jgi:hypothetical protein
MNPLQAIRPMAETKLALLPRLRSSRCDRVQFALAVVRFVQAALCIYSIVLMNRFEMFTLFEINCPPSMTLNQAQIDRPPLDATYSGPNMAYEQLRWEQLEGLGSQHWLFCKKQYRTYGYLTMNGRQPSSENRVYQVRNWMKLPFVYYPLLLPGSCSSVPKVLQFKMAARQAAEARQKREEASKGDQSSLAALPGCSPSSKTPEVGTSGSNSTSDNGEESNSVEACRPNPEENAGDSLDEDIQVVETGTGDYFQMYARLLQLSGTFSFLAMIFYCLWPTFYRQNRFFVMGFDIFFSAFLMCSSVAATNYFASAVNDLYDG